MGCNYLKTLIHAVWDLCAQMMHGCLRGVCSLGFENCALHGQLAQDSATPTAAMGVQAQQEPRPAAAVAFEFSRGPAARAQVAFALREVRWSQRLA